MYDKCIGLREEQVWLGWAAGGRLSFARTWLAAFMLVCACADVECPRADEVVAWSRRSSAADLALAA